MELGPAAVVEIEDVAAFHPDVHPHRRQHPEGIAIRRAGRDRVRLGHPPDTDRLDDEIA